GSPPAAPPLPAPPANGGRGRKSGPGRTYPRAGVCFARNSLTFAFAAVSAGSVFHSATNSQPEISFATSSEIGPGCASSLPASTRHGALIVFTNSRSALYTKPGA